MLASSSLNVSGAGSNEMILACGASRAAQRVKRPTLAPVSMITSPSSRASPSVAYARRSHTSSKMCLASDGEVHQTERFRLFERRTRVAIDSIADSVGGSPARCRLACHACAASRRALLHRGGLVDSCAPPRPRHCSLLASAASSGANPSNSHAVARPHSLRSVAATSSQRPCTAG